VKRRTLIFILTVFQFIQLFGQIDTIFLDRKFKPIERGNHSYYRIINKMPSGKYRILDYFDNGRIQMAGYSDMPDAKHLVGVVVRYGSQGKIISLCQHEDYDKGWITFYNKGMKKVASLWCINNKKNGDAYFYNRNGNVIAKGKFKDDRMYSGKKPGIMALMRFNDFYMDEYKNGSLIKIYKYYSNGNLAMKGNLIPEKYKLSDAIFYNKKGEKIGKCKYADKIPVEGKCMEFYGDVFFTNKPAKTKYLDTYFQGNIIHRESFQFDGKSIGNCSYKYNSPYDGKTLINNTLYTFQKGKKEGEVVIYNSNNEKIIHRYFLKDGKKEGKTLFYDTENFEYVGEFKDDQPNNGFVFSEKLCEYKNGLKNGICYSYKKDKLLSQTSYVNDIKEGQQIYYGYKDIEKVIGINKNNMPFSGDFQKGYRNRRFHINHYENGVELTQKIFRKDTFSLFSKEIFSENLIIKYNKDGSEKYRGIKKNNKPYNGTFANDIIISNYLNGKLNGEKKYFNYRGKLEKIEHYKNGILDGNIDFYYKDKLEYTCEFRDGKPYSGKMKDKNGNFIRYENGKLNGKFNKRINHFKCLINYIDGKKEGECICWNTNNRLSKISELDSFNSKPYSDTLFLIGTYLNGKPLDGIFVDKSSIQEYKEGKKNGYLVNFSKGNSLEIVSLLHYKNDSLDGVSKYFLDNNTFETTFDNGRIKNGFLIDENIVGGWKENSFQYYENYQKIDKFYKTQNGFSSIIIKNGKPFEGYKRRENNISFTDEYSNGNLIKTYYIVYKTDTILKTIYNGISSKTYNKDNEIVYKTNYKEKYNNGIAEHYIKGKLMNKIYFENNKIVKGCVEEDVISNNFFRKYKSIKVCKDSSELIIEFEFKNQRIKEEYIINDDSDVQWPLVMSQGNFYRLSYLSNNSIINYYDKESNTKLATFNKSSNKGIKIIQNGNEYEVQRYMEDETKLYKYGYEEMIIPNTFGK